VRPILLLESKLAPHISSTSQFHLIIIVQSRVSKPVLTTEPTSFKLDCNKIINNKKSEVVLGDGLTGRSRELQVMRNPFEEETRLDKQVIKGQQQALGNSISGCNPKVVISATTSIEYQHPPHLKPTCCRSKVAPIIESRGKATKH
jgi:hypothetical protein